MRGEGIFAKQIADVFRLWAKKYRLDRPPAPIGLLRLAIATVSPFPSRVGGVAARRARSDEGGVAEVGGRVGRLGADGDAGEAVSVRVADPAADLAGRRQRQDYLVRLAGPEPVRLTHDRVVRGGSGDRGP